MTYQIFKPLTKLVSWSEREVRARLDSMLFELNAVAILPTQTNDNIGTPDPFAMLLGAIAEL
jgi:hypothetical protein